MVPEDEEIEELSEEYREGSEPEPENRRKGVTFLELRRQKTVEQSQQSAASGA